MNKSLIIFGTGSLASIAYYYATQEMDFKVEAFIIDSNYKACEEFMDRPVFTWEKMKEKFEDILKPYIPKPQSIPQHTKLILPKLNKVK